MKIYKKKELPRHEEEEFSVIVLTCDEHGETNLGFYNFDTEDWSFLSEADQSNYPATGLPSFPHRSGKHAP